MGTHTPGPWQAIDWACHAPTTVIAGDRTVIAECSGHGRMTRDSVANARLIAAAPELLAACVAYLADRAEAGCTADSVAVKSMRAACAKATGSAT